MRHSMGTIFLECYEMTVGEFLLLRNAAQSLRQNGMMIETSVPQDGVNGLTQKVYP